MEGEVYSVHWFRTYGWWISRQCGEFDIPSAILDQRSSTSLLQSVLVLKYIIQNFEDQFYNYYGYANVVQNITLMFSAVILWFAQSAPSDYEYNLSI